MPKLDSAVNGILKKMHMQQSTGKGSFGEKAVLQICEALYQKEGGILIWSYSYKTDKNLAGNIKNENGKLYIENTGSETEIDVLYVSRYRVFPIEVKAYKATKIVFTDEAIAGCYKTNKSPVHQNEMHCRHLYSHIFKSIPNGSPDYIVPIVCMVDKATVIDSRSEWQKDYIKLCVLNNLFDTIVKYNTPLEFQLNLKAIDTNLKEVMVSNERYLPPRY